MSKVLMINGSPRVDGNTTIAVRDMENVFRKNGVEVTTVQVGNKAIRGCAACALATGTGDYVRCTPLEYSFHDGKFWIFTEGGEKFIGLEKNRNVSLAVFEKNPNFGELKSVQIMGVATMTRPMSEEYIAHAVYKKIPLAALQKLADQGRPMHLICITPTKMDVLFSEFKKQGYDSRQVLEYKAEV